MILDRFRRTAAPARSRGPRARLALAERHRMAGSPDGDSMLRHSAQQRILSTALR